MIAFFLIVFIVPLVAAGAAFILLNGITLKEFGLIVLAMLLVAGSSAGIISCANTRDVEVWNGVVTDKKKVAVPCEHSYSCDCHEVCSGSGKSKSCTTQCDTCYRHYTLSRKIPGNDYDWDVYTSNAETITIDRVDDQGVHEPPRFRAVKIGEPTSRAHDYVNYVKASPDSLFRHQGLKERFAGQLPAYPGNVYDYYRLDRLVTVDVRVEETRKWNADLAEINADLGRTKQVNMIVVVVKNKPIEYFSALEESWIGSKKNDAVLVISVDDQLKPQWTQVMAWTKSELFKVKLRDDVMSQQKLSRETTLKAFADNVRTNYVRKLMKDFEYLKSQITPSSTEWIITLIIAMLIAAGLVYVFQTQDVFNEE